jgi:hypothetical protein
MTCTARHGRFAIRQKSGTAFVLHPKDIQFAHRLERSMGGEMKTTRFVPIALGRSGIPFCLALRAAN